jgi:hypothetical protein
MVFFTVVIIAKKFIGLETCPLFEDDVGYGNFSISDDDLQNSLIAAGATSLASFPVWDNATQAISSKCATEYKMPEDYCGLTGQTCEASAFILNEKVRTIRTSLTQNNTKNI